MFLSISLKSKPQNLNNLDNSADKTSSSITSAPGQMTDSKGFNQEIVAPNDATECGALAANIFGFKSPWRSTHEQEKLGVIAPFLEPLLKVQAHKLQNRLPINEMSKSNSCSSKRQGVFQLFST